MTVQMSHVGSMMMTKCSLWLLQDWELVSSSILVNCGHHQSESPFAHHSEYFVY